MQDGGEERRQRPEFKALREEIRQLNKIRMNESTAASIDENQHIRIQLDDVVAA